MPVNVGQVDVDRGLEQTIVNAVKAVADTVATEIPVDVPFTALGITSLQIGRICAVLGEELKRPVPVSQMYRTATVRELATWLAQSTPVDNVPAVHTDKVALTPMQAIMFMKHVFDPDDLTLHGVRTWRVIGRPQRAALRAAIAFVHQRHQYLSAEYEFEKVPYAKPSDVPAPALVEVLVETEEEAHRALSSELSKPFRLMEGHVWRAVYVAVRREHVTLFGVAVHHVAFDGGSAGLLAGDIAKAYNAFKDDTVPALPPAPALHEVAAAQDAHLPYVDLEAQRKYWRTAVGNVHPLEFPGGTEAPAGTPCRMINLPLPDGTVAGITKLANRLKVSPFTVYLSAYGQTMAELTGGKNFGIGTPVNRRGNTIQHATVGCLIETICLRPRVDPKAAHEDLIVDNAQIVADAFAAQDIPASEVATMVSAPAPGRSPLFQTIFILQDNNPGDLPLDGVVTEFFRPDYPGVSSEVYSEIWPAADGSARLVIAYLPDRVTGDFCQRLAKRFTERLTAYWRIGED